MCTLLILRERVAGHPLVVGANRDEFRDRPWTPPRRVGPVLAPRDERAGGTWIGVSDAGVVVAATNWFHHADPDASRPSRGELVAMALESPDAGSALERVRRRTDEVAFNGFQLFVADRTRADVLHAPGDGSVLVDPVPTGFHVVTNRWRLDRFDHGGSLDPADQPAASDAESTFETLGRVLATHTGPTGADAICKHREDRGTLSSAIIALPESGPPVFLFAAGPPCEAPFVAVT